MAKKVYMMRYQENRNFNEACVKPYQDEKWKLP